MTPISERTVIALCIWCFMPSAAVAQSGAIEVAIGTVVPIEALGANRSAGPFIRAGVIRGNPTRVVRLRLDGEAMSMPGNPAPNRSAETTGDLRSIGFVATVVVAPPRLRVAPYFLFGAGVHLMSIVGADGPNNFVGGVRSGLGLRVNAARYRISLESSANLNLSDRATGRNFTLGSYVPITLAIVF